jgi:hypothetical protein
LNSICFWSWSKFYRDFPSFLNFSSNILLTCLCLRVWTIESTPNAYSTSCSSTLGRLIFSEILRQTEVILSGTNLRYSGCRVYLNVRLLRIVFSFISIISVSRTER